MRRIAIGAVAGLAVWIGSALAAEAQGITPTGPTCVLPGATSSTYTANVYLPTPCAYRLRMWVFTGPTLTNMTQIHYSESVIPNPGTQNSGLTKVLQLGQGPVAGDQVKYTAQIKVGTIWYPPVDWVITCQVTRPSSKVSSMQNSSGVVVQSIDRDRRRE
jgi:hypothetical protein